ncbi:MAG: pyroglutamyl-peptidase I [Ezakiella sp.]|nr:pyroglutamyl-peptidase I [Ezakiella sp.]
MKILITAFDAFGDDKINPTTVVLNNLPSIIKNASIYKLVIPTIRYKSAQMIIEKIEEIDPEVVISLGLAGGRPAISIERIAINIDDFRICDNEGNMPIDEEIVRGGAPAYFSTLPIKAMLKAIHEEGIAANISNTAGTFVCNHVMYAVADYLSKHNPQVRSGFIHIPYLDTMDKTPSMNLDELSSGIIAAIEAVVSFDYDIKIPGGSLH